MFVFIVFPTAHDSLSMFASGVCNTLYVLASMKEELWVCANGASQRARGLEASVHAWLGLRRPAAVWPRCHMAHSLWPCLLHLHRRPCSRGSCDLSIHTHTYTAISCWNTAKVSVECAMTWWKMQTSNLHSTHVCILYMYAFKFIQGIWFISMCVTWDIFPSYVNKALILEDTCDGNYSRLADFYAW